MNIFSPIEAALEDLCQGRMLLLVDDEKREHEGDIVIAAEKISPAAINFMLKNARGMLCLSITDDIVKRLDIPLMPERNKHLNQAAFTVSIEAASGVTSGMSVNDRTKTILTVIDPMSTVNDVSMPGHVFPLVARPGGVLERPGHTEGSVDLAKLAGLLPAAVICEVMNDDGSMARLPNLSEFAVKHGIKLVSINDLIAYRLAKE
jgi:3,4-dihydroxy 2-butanone 4-phosphate synthase/GTP cyclohydrolase II